MNNDCLPTSLKTEEVAVIYIIWPYQAPMVLGRHLVPAKPCPPVMNQSS